MSTKDLFDNEAQLDDEEEDEDFDEETGEARKGLSRANGDLNDSSEEEDDEDDEDAAREVSPRNLSPFVRRPLTRTRPRLRKASLTMKKKSSRTVRNGGDNGKSENANNARKKRRKGWMKKTLT
jgi:hypothetical protein